MKDFSVEQASFSGPFSLLLELLEREKLSITEISLAKITDDYLSLLQTQPVPAEELGDFLIVASRLLWLKSKMLLPHLPPEEEENLSLADQLRAYQIFVDVSEKIASLYASPFLFFERKKGITFSQPHFSVPASLTPIVLQESFFSLLKKLEPLFSLGQTSLERVVSLEEKIQEFHKIIIKHAHLSFSVLIGKTHSRMQMVVSFLAILELTRQRLVQVVQSNLFEDITLKQIK